MQLGHPRRPGSSAETLSERVHHLVSRLVRGRRALRVRSVDARDGIFKRICELLAPADIGANHGSRASDEKNESLRMELREFGGGHDRAGPNIIQSWLHGLRRATALRSKFPCFALSTSPMVARGGQFCRVGSGATTFGDRARSVALGDGRGLGGRQGLTLYDKRIHSMNLRPQWAYRAEAPYVLTFVPPKFVRASPRRTAALSRSHCVAYVTSIWAWLV